MATQLRVALLHNLKRQTGVSPPSAGEPPDDSEAEWDTPETIAAVRDALSQEHEVIPIDAGPSLVEDLLRARPEIAFQMAEGSGSACREAHVPSVLELLGIPYTGSDPLTLALSLDKGRAKEVLRAAGVPTADFWVASSEEDLPRELPFPLVVKPLHEGSSVGMFDDGLVEGPEELRERVARTLRRYSQPALVERYLPGREFTVALLGNGDDLEVLPIVEIDFAGLPPGARPLYSYEAKWVWDRSETPLQVFRCPAELSPELRGEVEEVARGTFAALRCRDWCRVDMRLDEEGVPRVLELNPLPGILPRPEENSCFPKAARAAGYTFEELILKVLALAAERTGLFLRESAPLGRPDGRPT